MNIFIYIHVCIHVHIYIYIYMCVNMSIDGSKSEIQDNASWAALGLPLISNSLQTTRWRFAG